MIKLRSPMATALAVGLLATPVASVAAQDDLMAPAAVTGTTTFMVEEAGGSRAWIDGAIRSKDVVVSTTWDASDPRLSGAFTATVNRDLYERLVMQVAQGIVVLENDDGRWTGNGTYLRGEKLGETLTVVMHGEGAHDGLTAYAVIDNSEPPTFNAAIFPGDSPTVPVTD